MSIIRDILFSSAFAFFYSPGNKLIYSYMLTVKHRLYLTKYLGLKHRLYLTKYQVSGQFRFLRVVCLVNIKGSVVWG
jgi:hypothetical protein